MKKKYISCIWTTTRSSRFPSRVASFVWRLIETKYLNLADIYRVYLTCISSDIFYMWIYRERDMFLEPYGYDICSCWQYVKWRTVVGQISIFLSLRLPVVIHGVYACSNRHLLKDLCLIFSRGKVKTRIFCCLWWCSPQDPSSSLAWRESLGE